MEIQEERIYRDLSDLKEVEGVAYGDLVEIREIMVDAIVQASLVGTPSVISSGVDDFEATPSTEAHVKVNASGTDAQVQVDASGIDAQPDRAAS